MNGKDNETHAWQQEVSTDFSSLRLRLFSPSSNKHPKNNELVSSTFLSDSFFEKNVFNWVIHDFYNKSYNIMRETWASPTGILLWNPCKIIIFNWSTDFIWAAWTIVFSTPWGIVTGCT